MYTVDVHHVSGKIRDFLQYRLKYVKQPCRSFSVAGLELYGDDAVAAVVVALVAAVVNLQRWTHLVMTKPRSSAVKKKTILVRLIKRKAICKFRCASFIQYQ